MAQLAMQNFLTKGYMGNPPLLSGSEEFGGAPYTWRTTTFAAAALDSVCSPEIDEQCQHRLAESISTSFTNMTAFMTNIMRKTSGFDEISCGVSYTSTQVYHIRYDRVLLRLSALTPTDSATRWAWISYPAAGVLCVCCFVGITIWRSRNTQPWKTSMLPALFHSIRELDQNELPHLAFPAAMRRRAEELLAELQEMNDAGGEAARWQWKTGGEARSRSPESSRTKEEDSIPPENGGMQ
jgi:hypothetical protein